MDELIRLNINHDTLIYSIYCLSTLTGNIPNEFSEILAIPTAFSSLSGVKCIYRPKVYVFVACKNKSIFLSLSLSRVEGEYPPPQFVRGDSVVLLVYIHRVSLPEYRKDSIRARAEDEKLSRGRKRRKTLRGGERLSAFRIKLFT